MEIGNGDLMVVLLSIRTGVTANLIILVLRHVLKCLEAEPDLLRIGMTNFAHLKQLISVRKKEVGT